MPTHAVPLIRVLIVDDHAVVRAGLRMLIENQTGLTVVGEAGTGAEAVAAAARQQPNIILLDLALGAESGLDVLPELLVEAPEARVIVLTGLRETEVQHRAVRLGATGLVLKEQAAEDLLKAIRKVHAGEVWLDRAMTASVLTEMARARSIRHTDPEAAKIATLTEREREVIALLGEGLKNRQIARRLSISETTVRHHLTSIFSKLEVSDRLELLIYAFRHELTELPTPASAAAAPLGPHRAAAFA
ncbi:MAG: response regulator transcription factor [Ardenticatenaceae bacterium]|nr:response regulator transcription factor [Ardenticatenaceae bacterium]